MHYLFKPKISTFINRKIKKIKISQVASFRVIDARYSYEFQGGHIRGAENFGMWDEKAFFQEFFPENLGPKKMSFFPANQETSENNDLRKIIIFHCEFSSARGPALMRALRKK